MNILFFPDLDGSIAMPLMALEMIECPGDTSDYERIDYKALTDGKPVTFEGILEWFKHNLTKYFPDDGNPRVIVGKGFGAWAAFYIMSHLGRVKADQFIAINPMTEMPGSVLNAGFLGRLFTKKVEWTDDASLVEISPKFRKEMKTYHWDALAEGFAKISPKTVIHIIQDDGLVPSETSLATLMNLEGRDLKVVKMKT